MEETIGFVFTDEITTKLEYLEVKVILQGTKSHHTYTLVKNATFEHNLEVDSSSFMAGNYTRIYIGVLQNKEEIIKQDYIFFKADPKYAYKKINFYETMYNNISAYLLEPDSIRHQSYTIEGKSITRLSHEYLMTLREKCERRMLQERKGINTSVSPKSITLEF